MTEKSSMVRRALDMIPPGGGTIASRKILRNMDISRWTLDPIIEILESDGLIEVLKVPPKGKVGGPGRSSRQLRRIPKGAAA